MTTKKCHNLPIKGIRNLVISDPSNSKYSNLNLNQINRNSTNAFSESSKNAKIEERKVLSFDDFAKTNDLQKSSHSSWNKSTKELSRNFANNAFEKEDTFKKRSATKSAKNSSTLYLQIAAYENSIEENLFDREKEGLRQNGLIKKRENGKEIFKNSVIHNPFEFPRQQNEERSQPEVSQFKASQRLHNPNQMNQHMLIMFGTGTGLFGSTQPASGGSSIFGQQTSTQPSGTGLFGTQQTASQSSGTGLFGSTQPASAQPSTGGSIFGSAQQASGTGLFGSNQPTSTQFGSGGSIFGSTQQTSTQSSGTGLFGSTQPSTGGSIFGSAQPASASGGSSIFGQQTASQPSGTGLFGSTQPSSASSTGSIFGQPTSTQSSGTGLFGSTQPSSASGGSSIFGQQTASQPSGTGLFGSTQPASAQQTTGGSIFGSAQQTSSQSSGTGLFGTQPASAQPTIGGNLFSTTQPTSSQSSSTGLFGSTQPASASGGSSSSIFGKPSSTQSSGTGLFGTQPPSSSAATGQSQPAASQSSGTGLLGSTQPASAQPTTGGNLFSTTQQTSTQSSGTGLFGTQPASTTKPGGGQTQPTSSQSSSTGLFGTTQPASSKPAGSLFGPPQPASTTAGTTSNAASTAGLGGILKQEQTGTSEQVGGDSLVREIPQQLKDELEKLQAHIKEMRMSSENFKSNSSQKDSIRLNEELSRLRTSINLRKNDLHQSRAGIEDLLAAVRRDNRIIALISREKEGRGKMIALEESWEHMLQELSGIERKVLNMNDQVSKLERIIMDTEGESLTDFSRKDLETHLQRFDGIFNAIAMQVSELREKTGDTREQYLEWLRRIHGPYAPNPFEQKRLAKQKEAAASILNEIGPIPSVDAVMQYRDVLAQLPQNAQPQLGGGPSAFGTTSFQQQQPSSLFGPKPSTGNLFGSKPSTVSPFPFSNPAASNTSNSLFKPFSTTTTTANTTPSLFGTPQTSTTAQSQSTPVFGKTLSSSSSGTLFGGTASKQQFFGK
uniref:Uncharacterized protein n=1 Tax=Panagrolaimus sp. PS1159 TaxID=55785 RepID=A0AC35F6S0_9BILA